MILYYKAASECMAHRFVHANLRRLLFVWVSYLLEAGFL